MQPCPCTTHQQRESVMQALCTPPSVQPPSCCAGSGSQCKHATAPQNCWRQLGRPCCRATPQDLQACTAGPCHPSGRAGSPCRPSSACPEVQATLSQSGSAGLPHPVLRCWGKPPYRPLQPGQQAGKAGALHAGGCGRPAAAASCRPRTPWSAASAAWPAPGAARAASAAPGLPCRFAAAQAGLSARAHCGWQALRMGVVMCMPDHAGNRFVMD